MKKICLSLMIFILLYYNIYSQEQRKYPLLISVSNNATQMPGSGYLGFFTVPVHPGISAGTEITLKDWHKSSLYESFRLGGYYHKYSQLAIELYSELIYQYRIGSFSLEPQFQAGYLMAFSDLQEFELEGEVYQGKNFTGKSRFMTGAGLGFAWTFNTEKENPVKISLAYIVNLQMPFVKNYATLLIVTSLQAGVAFYLPCKNK